MGAPDLLRLVPELRAVHIERHLSGTPAELVYLDAKYDLAGTPLVAGIRRVTLLGACRTLFTTRAATLELPEPLWMRFWPRHVALLVVFHLAGALRRKPHRVRTYAMENNSFATLVGGSRRVPRVLISLAAVVVGGVARLGIERICYASPAARVTYESLPFISAIPSTVSLELPAAVPHVAPSAAVVAPLTAVFLGSLEPRKGLRVLMRAWEEVEVDRPEAHLTVIGPGPLAAEIRVWADARPASRTMRGPMSHRDARAVVERAAVLVAPSIPEGRWREQVGLPIKEGLAVGATIVTTRQTGLAEWLTEHGHEVVDVDRRETLPSRLAAAIERALVHPLDRETVRAALPDVDGRLDADAWLHRQNCSR